jgi:hypothetical protein
MWWAYTRGAYIRGGGLYSRRFTVFFKDTLYFLLKYVLPPVLFTLTQVDLLLITSTFTRVQIQSNLGTTERQWPPSCLHFSHWPNE